MLSRNAVKILCLIFVFPVQVSPLICSQCNQPGSADQPKACVVNAVPLPCSSPDAWCAILKDKTGVVVWQRCTEDDEVPEDQREKGKFCGIVDGLEMCACSNDHCNDPKCKCETKPKEKTMEPGPEESVTEPPEPESEPDDETEAPKEEQPKPTKVSPLTCAQCKMPGSADHPKGCISIAMPYPCLSPDAWCAIFKDKTGVVVWQKCTEGYEVPEDQREKGKFCGIVDGLEMCACSDNHCNDEHCKCETKPKEEKTTKPRWTTKRTKKSNSTKTSGTKKPKTTELAGTKEATSTSPPKSTKRSSEPTSTVSPTPKQDDPKHEKVGDGSNGNMVVVGWETVFIFVCVSVFQILH